MNSKIKIIECPRDAFQGIEEFIPTKLKIKYINQLLKVDFILSILVHLCLPRHTSTK